MKILNLITEIKEGKDKDVDLLHDGSRQKIMQITLRNGAVLSSHQAPEPITIQYISGKGILNVAGILTDLRPGVLVALDANEIHEIVAQPNVSVLLSRFLV